MHRDKDGLDFDYLGKWQAVNRIRRHRSLQSQVAFVAGHLPADAMEEDTEMARLLPKTCSRDSSPASFVTARTHLSSDHDVILPSGPQSGETQVPPKGIFARRSPMPKSSPNGSRQAPEGAPGTRWSSREEQSDKPVVGPYAFYVPTVQEESVDSEQSKSVRSPSASATSGGKRKMAYEEEEISSAQAQSAAKKRKTTSNARSLSASTTWRSKRKMVYEEEDHDQSQPSSTQGQSAAKKRKTVTHTIPPPAAATSAGKGKRDRKEDCAAQEQAKTVVAKKRRASKSTKPPQTSALSGPQTTQGVSAVARVTRAQRRLFSEGNAQLFRLGQHGELDVQGISDQVQEDDVSNNTATGRLK
ncbi:hypothetical protein VP1G_09128 [Cytospora mali]|uniref:Uncharacterized protein n=1 Tax=Cytospora mali TaxID=578113 RepID=A0A194VDD1_CYTMA|nr:hypothetical protein VP1G_09128 [Valsa mali var. pyri (nom. inval.)]